MKIIKEINIRKQRTFYDYTYGKTIKINKKQYNISKELKDVLKNNLK